MSEALYVYNDHSRRTHWFECPRCAARQEVTSQVWASVEVLGQKPVLDVCEHRPHIPPSPATLAAFGRDKAILDLMVLVAKAGETT